MDLHSQSVSRFGNRSAFMCPALKIFLCFLLCLVCPLAHSQSNPELENIKKIILSINKDNSISFHQPSLDRITISPRTYRKLISFKNEEISVSYGLNAKTQPILFLQLKSAKGPQAFFEIFDHTLTLTPGSSVTITLGDSPKNSLVTAGHYGYVRLDKVLLSPGINTLIDSQKAVDSTSSSTSADSEKKRSSLNDPSADPLLSQSRTSLSAIERRKIQIQELRETSEKLVPPTSPKPTSPKTEPKSVSEIVTKSNPAEEAYRLRENQVLIQLAHGLQSILDQITNNPLSADDTFQMGLPPLPPIATQPAAASHAHWIDQIQRENTALEEKVLATRANLLKFLETLPRPSFHLTPLIPEGLQEFTRLASQAYKQQKWDEAVSQYKTALAKEPNSLHVLSNLGVVYFSQGNYDAAEKTLLQTIRQAPHDSFSHSILGISYFQKGDLENAINSLLTSVLLNPKDPQAQNYLAMALTKKEWLVPAEEHARESIRLNPNNSEAHYNLAQIYSNQQPVARELARKHYMLSVNLGGTRDEAMEGFLQIPPQNSAPTEPQIQVNP